MLLAIIVLVWIVQTKSVNALTVLKDALIKTGAVNIDMREVVVDPSAVLRPSVLI
jgi:hypothetical protein